MQVMLEHARRQDWPEYHRSQKHTHPISLLSLDFRALALRTAPPSRPRTSMAALPPCNAPGSPAYGTRVRSG